MKNLKYFLLTCFSVLLVSFRANAQYVTGYSDLNDSDVTKALKSHITYLSSAELEGRKAGSEGEKAAADYIRTCLESYGVELLSGKDGDLFGISMQGGDTLTSRNVVGVVQGYDKTKNDRYIVVGARLDNLGVNTLEVDGKPSSQIYYGANGNASGLAVMTELARMISLNAILFRRSVVFVAFGASCQSFAGAWYFINRSFPDAGKIDAMIDLDMLGTQSGGFYAYTASNADMNMILSQVGSELQPIVPKLTSEESYPSDNMAFYSGEIPSVMFTTGKYPEHNTVRDSEDIIEYEPMERELEYIYNFTRYIANVENAPLFRQDQVLAKGNDKLYAYYECDRRPSFLGSADPKDFLYRWVYQYLKYPKTAVANGIQGRVTVEFTIDKKGDVKDVHVARSADPLLDEEAVRVISASPRWKPGVLKGEAVNTVMSVAVDFKLSKKSKFGIKK